MHDQEPQHCHHWHHPFAWLFAGLFLYRVGAGKLLKLFLLVLAIGAVVLATTSDGAGFVVTTGMLVAAIFWWASR